MKDLYIRINKKRLLHISTCIFIWLVMLMGGSIIIFIDINKIASVFVVLLSIQVGMWLREYRDWVEKKYPKEEKEVNDERL